MANFSSDLIDKARGMLSGAKEGYYGAIEKYMNLFPGEKEKSREQKLAELSRLQRLMPLMGMTGGMSRGMSREFPSGFPQNLKGLVRYFDPRDGRVQLQIPVSTRMKVVEGENLLKELANKGFRNLSISRFKTYTLVGGTFPPIK